MQSSPVQIGGPLIASRAVDTVNNKMAYDGQTRCYEGHRKSEEPHQLSFTRPSIATAASLLPFL